MIEFILNSKKINTDLPPTTVLLDFIRRESQLTGTKEGCREGDCGACSVILGALSKNRINYISVNSCLVPIADVHGKHVVTIEGLNSQLVNSDELSPIQLAMAEEGGTQCGFCTPGFVISMTSYFLNNNKPNVESAVNSLGGNICRCTGYAGIIRAVEKSIDVLNEVAKQKNIIKRLIEAKFIPSYFLEIPKQLKLIKKQKSKVKADFLIGGGTDLYVQRWEELVQTKSEFVNDKKVNNEIKIAKNKITLGGAVTVQQLLESKIISKYLPTLQSQLELFGSLPIRNRATLAGNLVNASPIGDIANILLALDAEIYLVGKSKKTIPLKNFFLDYKVVNKKKSDLVESISLNIPPKKFYFNYEKVSKRTFLDIASVNSSIGLTLKKEKIEHVVISAGGVGPIPLVLKNASKHLIGKEITAQIIKECGKIALNEISPISDSRGSKDYKSLLLRQLIYAHFIMLFPDKINVEELI